jgi:hypothetical protein
MSSQCHDTRAGGNVERQWGQAASQTQRHRSPGDHADDAVIDRPFDGPVVMQPDVGDSGQILLGRGSNSAALLAIAIVQTRT